MAEGAEVARAVVTLIPSMKGSQETITKELTGASEPAGKSAGQAIGNNMVSSISSSMSAAGATLTKGVTVPLAAIGTASVMAFKEVDSGLDTIRTKTGASGDALEQMGGIMENIATSIPTSFDEAGAAIGEVNTRFKLTGQDLEDLSTEFIKFAKLNNTDVSSSVDNVSKVIEAFGMEAEDAGGLLDALNQVGQDTGVDMDTLSTYLYQNATQLQEMGMSAYDAAGFLGACDTAGLDISTTMMGLKTAMKNATGEGKDLDTFLSEFSNTMNSNASESDKLAAAYETFGTRAGGAIYNAVKNGKLDLEDLTGSLGDFAGSVDKTFDEVIDPTDQFTQVLNELKIMGADIAQAILPVLKDVLDSILPVIKNLVDGWNNLPPGMQDFIVKAGLVVAAIGPVLSIGGNLVGMVSDIKGAFGNLTTTFSSASQSFGGITGLMKSNVSDLTETMTGKLGVAGAAVGTFMAAFSITDWILEITGAKEQLEQFGSDIYDFFHQAEQASVDLTNSAMAAFEAYALRGEGTFEEVMQKLTEAQKAASDANTSITNQDAETLQKYIDLMENGVAETRAKEAQARQAANDTMIAENQMTAETLKATMDAAQNYIETGAGNTENIMANLQTAYEQYSAQNDATSQEAAASVKAMMDEMTAALSSTSETMSFTAETAAENLQIALADATAYLETGKGDTEQILENLQAAYEFYASQTDDSSQAVATSVDQMVSAVESASGVSISATENLEENTTADLAAISQAMSDLGITDVGQFVTAIETGLNSVDTAFGTTQESLSRHMTNMSTDTSNAMKEIQNKFTEMKTSVNATMKKVSQEVSNEIRKIQNQFSSAQLRFNQHIALPHFSMSGSFNAETGQVPSVSVSWYKKAAEEGALFANPAIIGVGDASQPEMLIGQDTLYQQISKAMSENNGGDIIIPVYLGGEMLDEIVLKAIQRNNYRSGGRS